MSADVPAGGRNSRAGGVDLESVEGRDGWLFMSRFERIDVLELYRDPTRAIPPETFHEWSEVLRERREHFASTGRAYVTLIVPDNLAVYPDQLPEGIVLGRRTPAEELIRTLDEETAEQTVYVREHLVAGRARADTCRRTDSHWTDWGAFLAYRATLAAAARQLPEVEVLGEDRLERTVRTGFGDLGAKLVPERSETYETIVIPDDGSRLVESFQTHRRDTCSIFEQDRPDLPTAVVFRDSAMTAAAKFFTQSFRRVVYIATTSEIYDDLIELEQPDLVIHELGERKLVVRPVRSTVVDYRARYAEFAISGKNAREAQRQARTMLEDGDPQAALRRSDDVLSVAGPTARLLTFRSEAYRALEDLHGEIETLVHAVALDPTDGFCHSRLGDALSRAGSTEAALIAFEHATHAEPRKSEYWTDAIAQARKIGRPERAADLAGQAVRHFPADARLQRTRTAALLDCGRLEEAADAAGAAYRADPEHRDGARLLLGVLLELERWSEAEPVLTKVAAWDPEDLTLQHKLAFVRMDLDLWRDALDVLRGLDPELAPHPDQWRAMMVSCLIHLGELQEAEDLAARLLDVLPGMSEVAANVRALRLARETQEKRP